MASTNKTSNLGLSQFQPADKPSWQGDYNSDMKKIDDTIGKLKKVTVETTLLASGWVNGIYTIQHANITATNDNVYLPAIGISTTQLEALQSANIVDNGQEVGKAYLRAVGDVPTIDIPIRVVVKGEV